MITQAIEVLDAAASGLPVAIPASIALDRMSEPEFIAFFQKVEKWLSETYGYYPEMKGAA